MSKKNETLTISATAETKQQLLRLAKEQHCFWGTEPSLTELIKRIADGTIPIGKPKNQSAEAAPAEIVFSIAQCRRALKKALKDIEGIEGV